MATAPILNLRIQCSISFGVILPRRCSHFRRMAAESTDTLTPPAIIMRARRGRLGCLSYQSRREETPPANPPAEPNPAAHNRRTYDLPVELLFSAR